MKVFVRAEAGVVYVRARAEGGDLIGDLSRAVKPGESFLGRAYDEWRALGDGEHDLEPKENEP